MPAPGGVGGRRRTHERTINAVCLLGTGIEVTDEARASIHATEKREWVTDAERITAIE